MSTAPAPGAPRVAVLDYDAGNIRSAARALERAGAHAWITADADDADAADALLVPGVGHFGQCVEAFRARGFDELVGAWQRAGRPILGVCVGMQILYEGSEEAPEVPGLGLLPGVTRRLPEGIPVPHMGWNRLEVVRNDPVLAGLDGAHVYFVHSYYAEPADDTHTRAVSEYGVRLPAVVRVDRIVATQFHPEKSAAVGARLLANWLASEVREGHDIAV
ncbi:imidazole glycerol phosphate synthase subunit HisH [Egibacter rhizosphaerae]|uniref:Imidazole glycerol phosphate synthase subunit HisH n=1 Tax=Egibacter rhizosphaerae TaxID=1670831 RepID=A0A411YKR4_9ACTN|nr:imidazole glycerol phosphate synthase subunit HisH [Egibacter rhizosphaerae]QBI21808.1 imidazole glycerol phosphate synthase subunit HisH [Egibacter rhizosphaerae]